jgi:hypothetical protein
MRAELQREDIKFRTVVLNGTSHFRASKAKSIVANPNAILVDMTSLDNFNEYITKEKNVYSLITIKIYFRKKSEFLFPI